MRRVVFDTNIWVDWLRSGLHAEWILGSGLVRIFSSVVELELRAGVTSPKALKSLEQLVRAHERANRMLSPSSVVFREAGTALQKLKSRGLEPRRSSLVNDVLLAASVRSVGATLVTRDADFESIRNVIPFQFTLLQ